MSNRRIYITKKDKEKLIKLISDISRSDIDAQSYISKLEHELDIAEEVTEDKLPSDVVAMNSTALLSFDDFEEEVTLVYPDKADMANNRISVLSPMGTAILGYKKGDSIIWDINDRNVTITIKDVYKSDLTDTI